MNIQTNTGCVLVSWTNLDDPEKMVVLIGVKQSKHGVDIIKYFSGKDAKDVYDKLFKEMKNDDR